jgi:hypothetical protein
MMVVEDNALATLWRVGQNGRADADEMSAPHPGTSCDNWGDGLGKPTLQTNFEVSDDGWR